MQVHSQELLSEAVVLLAIAIMEFSDAGDDVALLTKPQHPARDAPVICKCIVPISRLMRKPPGCHRGARRTADRACRVGTGESHTAGCELVDGWRLHDLMAITAQNLLIVVVGLYEDEIGRQSHLTLQGSPRPAGLGWTTGLADDIRTWSCGREPNCMDALGNMWRLVTIGLFAAGTFPAAAQSFPSRNITLVVAAAAGGGHDAVARAIAQNLKVRLGWTVIVENRGGANGMIAAEAVAKSTPDGHTILISTPTNNYVTPELRKDMRFDPTRDLAPITLAGVTPLVLVAHPSAKA